MDGDVFGGHGSRLAVSYNIHILAPACGEERELMYILYDKRTRQKEKEGSK